ncbi:hypothetical protein ACTA71_006143 [Dictyostelium dimigraforme]
MTSAQPKPVDVSTIPGFKKWLIVYPNHINSELTKDKGRKISKEHGVKNPTLPEIAEATAQLGLPCIIETTKGYPKEFFLRGRLRINFFCDGTTMPRNPHIPNKTVLLVKIAERIKLINPNRPEPFNPISMLAPIQAVSQKEKKVTPPPTTTSTTSTTSTSSSSSSSKGGKKKKNVNVI